MRDHSHIADFAAALCPLACAVALLPAASALDLLVQMGGLTPLMPLFDETHPILGSVVRLERCVECARLKREYTALNRRLQEARQKLRDDTETSAARLPGSTEAAQTSAACKVAAAEVEDLRAQASTASDALKTHRDSEHASADIEFKDPRRLNESVAKVWEAVPIMQRPRTLYFSAPTVIDNSAMGRDLKRAHQVSGRDQRDTQYKRNRLAPVQQHGQQTLLERQAQLEAAILALSATQVAALPPDHAAMYWRLKRGQN